MSSGTDVPAPCEAFDEDLSALIDEELSAEREAEVRAHLEGCAVCRLRFEGMAQVDLALALTPVPEIPGDLRSRLQERIAREGRASPERRTATTRPVPRAERARRRLARPALGVALAAAAAVALYLAVTRAPAPEGAVPGPPIARKELSPAPLPGPAVAPVERAPERLARSEPPAPDLPRPPGGRESPRGPEAPVEVAPRTDAIVLAEVPEEEVEVALNLETIEDIGVIANLDLLERWLALEEAG